MKICFDSCAFNNQEYGGITNYYTNLICKLTFEHQVLISCKYSNNHALNNLGLNFEKYDKSKYIDILIENQKLNLANIMYADYDVFHHTGYNYYFLDYIKKPFVITIHDLLQERLYGKHTAWNADSCLNKLIDKASHIITISNQSKKDILEYYKVSEDKISVVYHGYTPLPENYKYCDLNVDCQYILYVGLRTTQNNINYKNFIPFVFGALNFLKKHSDVKIVITGEGLTDFEIELFRQLDITDKIIFTGYIDDDVLNSLYHNALAFVFPSEYEGFGLPILESYKNNCITLLNDTNVFREIGADTDLFFNIKNNPNKISDLLEDIYYMSPIEKQKILDIQNNKLKEYSWDKSTQQHINIYNKVING